MIKRTTSLAAATLLFAIPALGAQAPATTAPSRPAPTQARPTLANIRYDLTFDSTTAVGRSVTVAMQFDVGGNAPVHLSLPAWTPGSYEISNFARRVSGFSATMAGSPVTWTKTDFDTWRVTPEARGTVEVRFDFKADTLDNAMAWSRRDFALVNGTNVFLYPEETGFDFSSRVTIHTQPGWRVVTGLDPDTGQTRAAGQVRYRAGNYHDLVDSPFFIGRFDLDSAQIDGAWHRLASYPAGQLSGSGRALLWQQLRGFVPRMSKVFGEVPFAHYSTLIIFDRAMGGGSALEHRNSHVGIYNPDFIGTPLLASITAHEMIHAWNVKRLRPAEMVPYRYDRPQPTPLLWVSEGFTDYYADLVLVRGGVIDSTVFLAVTEGKIQNVIDRPAVSLHDASLTTWIHPLDGTEYIYYDKGSLVGLLLDILIRDASDNRNSLDTVMRSLYRSTYQTGRGFTTADFWAAASAAAGGKSFADFAAKYVDGRDPLPWTAVAPLAGLAWDIDTTMVPRLGVSTMTDSTQVIVTGVTPGSAADQAGLESGDALVRVGDVVVRNDEWGTEFRNRYGNAEGTPISIVVRRGGAERTLSARIRLDQVINGALDFDPKANARAVRIRHGILSGN
jgi:predicted metalloprotease with PDZ domain